jgi:pimeloyl-ACP methyl ester carboxylesterase
VKSWSVGHRGLTWPGAFIGIAARYEESGVGPLAVYGHGLFFSRAVERRLGFLDWSPIAAAGLRLVRYDACGHGQSPGPPDLDGYTFEQYGSDLHGLLDRLGADGQVHGIGSSLGSAALLWAAVTEPSRFDRLVVVVAPRWADRAASAELYLSWADRIDRDGAERWTAALRSIAPPRVLSDVADYPPAPDIRPDLLPAVLRGVASSDLPELGRLPELTHPTLVLAWRTDPSHPVTTAERLAAAISRAQVEIADTLPVVRRWGERGVRFLADPQ